MYDEEWIRKELLPTISRFVRTEIRKTVEPLQDEIAALKTRVAELEENGIRYCGIYQRALPYRRGDQVTHDGARHTALRDIQPCEAPLKSDGWQLSDKSIERRLPTKGTHAPPLERRT